jgi:hypothetical protein
MSKFYIKSKGILTSSFHHHPPTLTHFDNMIKTTPKDYKTWKVYNDGKQKTTSTTPTNCLSRKIASNLS